MVNNSFFALRNNIRLTDAIRTHNVNKLRILLEKGVNPNVNIDRDHLTALHFAVAYNFLEGIPLLITAGANISAKSLHGVSPFDLAKTGQRFEIIKLFLSYSCKPPDVRNITLQ